ncbi:alpha/beta hydrolase [Parvicella tangerina]|uniref:Alpha/beta hydrolase n=1 Tax=Parvicella tangerina TaxID=2829795 RepID=A0A916JN70_9FLAO|nr:alpha/beta hydrolase-fold protein [Parvicella tangerina]CAG5081543.1 hypothetical protein CRYO30217_01662 [Parvicella tangerina]
MTRELFIAFFILSFQFNGLAQATKVSTLGIGEQCSFHSKILDEDRTLNVYLPDGYHPDSLQNYPVIYLLDGSMHEDMLHISGLVQFCSYSWINLIPECIVVGIANVNRYRDFTHIPENKEYLKSDPRRGGASKFIAFLENEVIPYVDHRYKTNKHRGLIGQSLGGLIATQFLIEKPQLFNHFFIVSPSLWYDDERLLSRDFSDLSHIESIYIAVGNEGKIMKRVAKKLFKKVKTNENNISLTYKYFNEYDHGDVLHHAIYEGFKAVGKTLKQNL